MKPTIFKLSLILFLGNVLFLSCRKPGDLVKPVPQTPPPVLSCHFQLTIDSLPDEPKAPVSNLFALVSVVNEKNDTVLANRKLAISFDGKFKTPELQLPLGNYRVTQMLIVNAGNQVRFATPVANSVKAALVISPLPVSFILPQPVVKAVAIEVLNVTSTDTPESFGYPAGLFNKAPNQPGDDNTASKIKLKLAMKVGEIDYDDMPGTVLYFAWDENQQRSGNYIPLAGGINELELSGTARRHQFLLTKWGQTYELNVLKKEVKADSVYILGGVKQAKKLLSELTYKLVGNNYVAESKNTYSYNRDGKLAGVDYYLKKADNSPYLAMKDQFQYSNSKLEKIIRLDEKNNESGSTSFSYNAYGKVNGIVELADNIRTTASVSYNHSPETGLTEVGFEYVYSHNNILMRYHQRYYQGNLLSDNSNTSHHNTETGQYSHDNNINPYAHMGWFNLFLSNQSKNNLIRQSKAYQNSYPVALAYDFHYKYDADGYPIELIRHYKSYINNQFLYTTKTVFNY